MFTPEIVEQLERPLSLDAGHEVRIQQELQNGTRAQWWVYTTEEPIRARLNEVDPGWGDRLANLTITATAATVAIEMTVLDVTRLGIGGASVKRDNDDVDQDVAKAAATDAFKRAARMFGIGAYLLSAPAIYTDWSPLERNMSPEQKKAAYAIRDKAKLDALAQFAAWYRKTFVGLMPQEPAAWTRDAVIMSKAEQWLDDNGLTDGDANAALACPDWRKASANREEFKARINRYIESKTGGPAIGDDAR